jgi:hypothetical protein
MLTWLLLDPSAGWLRLMGLLLAVSVITGIVAAHIVLDETMDDEEN